MQVGIQLLFDGFQGFVFAGINDPKDSVIVFKETFIVNVAANNNDIG